jgi:histidine ammonia-lyase
MLARKRCRERNAAMTVVFDGLKLSVAQVMRVVRPSPDGKCEKARLSPKARARIIATRKLIDETLLTDDAPLIYAFNTGVGLFKDRRITMAEMAAYQRNTIYAHATGIGEAMPEEIVRAMMLLRANAFASNYSGPRIAVVDRLIDCLNKGLYPIIPAKGSVGASGDLAPLAHMAGALCGFEEAEMMWRGKRMPAREALRKAGLDPDLELGAKDASALINGSTASLAYAVIALADAKRLLKAADLSLSLSLEAMRGERAAFDPRLHLARPHPGQAATARHVMAITEGSKRCSEAARLIVFPEENRAAGTAPSPRVQDVYSLRCAPQVHGPVREALAYIETIIAREINAATDNPLIFSEDGKLRSISGGHFHGQYLAQAMDLLSIVMTDLGSICERRLARLIDPTLSYGLPRNLLAGKQGLNTGFATVQCSLSALVMENRTLSMPASVDSIPGKSNAEDHVSNSTWAGRKARSILANVEQIIAGEMLMAAQALTLVEAIAKDHPIGKGSAAAMAAIRARIEPALGGDRWYATEMELARRMVEDGGIIAAVEAAIGPLSG